MCPSCLSPDYKFFKSKFSPEREFLAEMQRFNTLTHQKVRKHNTCCLCKLYTL